jgi:hypothetical protein
LLCLFFANRSMRNLCVSFPGYQEGYPAGGNGSQGCPNWVEGSTLDWRAPRRKFLHGSPWENRHFRRCWHLGHNIWRPRRDQPRTQQEALSFPEHQRTARGTKRGVSCPSCPEFWEFRSDSQEGESPAVEGAPNGASVVPLGFQGPNGGPTFSDLQTGRSPGRWGVSNGTSPTPRHDARG